MMMMMKVSLVQVLLSLSATAVHGFSSSFLETKVSSLKQPTRGVQTDVMDNIRRAVATSFVAGSLMFTSTLSNPLPAVAVSDQVYGSLETAIIDASDASYPILKSLSVETISPLSTKIASILSNKIPAEKLTKALDSTANTLLSIDDEKINAFVGTVKASYGGSGSGSDGGSIDACTTRIPIPTAAITTISNSDAVTKLNTEQIQKVKDKIITPLSKAVPSLLVDDVDVDEKKGLVYRLCLPPTKEGLEQVWIGQTKLVLSIPTPVKQQFAADITPALKSIPNSDLLRLLPEGKKILAGVDRKQASKFQQTGQALDKAFKQDSRLKAFQQ